MLSNGRLITAVYIQWVWTPSSKMVLCRPTSESLFFLGMSTFLYNLIYTADTARSGHASITGIDVLLELVQLPSIGSFQLLWRGWAERRPADVLIRCLIPIRYGLVLPWGFTVCGRLPTHTYTKHTHTYCTVRCLLLQSWCYVTAEVSPLCIKGAPSCRVVVTRQQSSKSAHSKQTATNTRVVSATVEERPDAITAPSIHWSPEC